MSMDKKCITGMGAALVDLFAPVSEAQLEGAGQSESLYVPSSKRRNRKIYKNK